MSDELAKHTWLSVCVTCEWCKAPMPRGKDLCADCHDWFVHSISIPFDAGCKLARLFAAHQAVLL